MATNRDPRSAPRKQPGAQQELFSEEGDFALEGLSAEPSNKVIFTIGHSTRKLEELVAALQHYGIRMVVDIRHFPSSRHNPQFNKGVLEAELRRRGIEYVWLERLGGYRSGGYRAYMETPAFTAGVDELERLAAGRRSAYMCAELKWWQCHRRHVSDALTSRMWSVIHILDEQRAEEHYQKKNRIKCD